MDHTGDWTPPAPRLVQDRGDRRRIADIHRKVTNLGARGLDGGEVAADFTRRFELLHPLTDLRGGRLLSPALRLLEQDALELSALFARGTDLGLLRESR